jgi:YggT family protein
MMWRTALIYLLESLVSLFVLSALTRFYAQTFRASFRNPIAAFTLALTDWAVKPLRRIVPSIAGLDTASFLVAWLTLIVLWGIILLLLGTAPFHHPLFWPTLAGLALIKLFKLSLYLLIGVVIVQAALSWVSPYHPMQPFFDALSKPFLRPLQRIIPLVGGVDLSPVLLLITVQVILMLPIAWLEAETMRVMANLALGVA